MHPEQNEEIQQALYYLNNRHRLKQQQIPQYMRALEIARKYCLEEQKGLWYAPEEKEMC